MSIDIVFSLQVTTCDLQLTVAYTRRSIHVLVSISIKATSFRFHIKCLDMTYSQICIFSLNLNVNTNSLSRFLKRLSRDEEKNYVSTNNIREDLFNMQQNMCCYLNNFTASVCHVYTAHIIYIYCLNGSHFLFEHKLNTKDILACLTTTITNWWASLALDDLS